MAKYDISKILEKVKLGNSFLTLGVLGALIALSIKYELGIKISFLTLFFGGVFRLLNMITKYLSRFKDDKVFQGYLFTILKFSIWLGALVLYAYFLDKLIPIF